MKIVNGTYRGCNIEFGLVPESPGQCYVNIEIQFAKLKDVLKSIQDDLIRKTFGFPPEDGDNFKLSVDKEQGTISWTFFYEFVGKCTQFEFLASIFTAIDKMMLYIPQKKE